MRTGETRMLVRRGYSDYDTYGSGNLFAAITDIIDAPDYMPQGSVRLHNTMVQGPSLSIAHRDGDERPRGCCHDGQEPATRWLPDAHFNIL